ncbi:hypothetical protein ANME2D_02491 [Candidatus Methanoperedens nitroreducens]|uniref:Uncharacterized protein n=1 Tax=Candidatus Methanoperedens nitratireducens TaxID=1392998 RepID=A0A062V669_9EURY|nr:hypothetical protein [Candidatus Methanoperedens nitroreducens]KCZ71289.1 hypothetical protein ANME2D_02491 [Candidatus Methanoperedens nitroreducens]MDJ1420283.1 hypothetical protein [Candidatus Methanoperedens sp.]
MLANLTSVIEAIVASINIVTVISSIITIIVSLPLIVGFTQSMIYRLLRKKGRYEGIWHAYHFTSMHGKTLLRHEVWVIKRNIVNKLIITTKDPKNPDLEYKGVISKERNYLLILLKGGHDEEVQMRFFDIIPTGQDIAFGLAMGVDFDNKPQCLIRIMSRKEFTDEEARDLLLSKTKIKNPPGIISINDS